MGPPTRRAAGPSPRAGGRERLSSAWPARDRTKFSPPPAPVHPASGLAPQYLVLLPARTPPGSRSLPGGWSRSLHPPHFLQGSVPPGTDPQSANPPGLPGKSRLSPHRPGGTLRWGLTPAPSSAGGHAGTCGSGLPGRRGRRQSLFPRMRRSLPGAGAPGALCSPHLGGGLAGNKESPRTPCPRRPLPLPDVHLQHPCAAELPGPRCTFHPCALLGPRMSEGLGIPAPKPTLGFQVPGLARVMS